MQLQFRTKKHFINAFLMPVQPLAVNLGPLKGRDSPFFQVDDILTPVVLLWLSKYKHSTLINK